MRSIILSTTLLALAAGTIGCSFAARSPDMYRDDVRALLDTKSGDIKACYDVLIRGDQNAVGNVTVMLDVEAETGAIQNVMVDEQNSTAPQPVRDCVSQSIQGLVLQPGDASLGKGTFVYEFTIAPQATAAAAPAAG